MGFFSLTLKLLQLWEENVNLARFTFFFFYLVPCVRTLNYISTAVSWKYLLSLTYWLLMLLWTQSIWSKDSIFSFICSVPGRTSNTNTMKSLKVVILCWRTVRHKSPAVTTYFSHFLQILEEMKRLPVSYDVLVWLKKSSRTLQVDDVKASELEEAAAAVGLSTVGQRELQ